MKSVLKKIFSRKEYVIIRKKEKRFLFYAGAFPGSDSDYYYWTWDLKKAFKTSKRKANIISLPLIAFDVQVITNKLAKRYDNINLLSGKHK